MSPEQEALVAKADAALRTGRRNLEEGDTEAAVNRAYYAAFYAATAALLGEGARPRSHAGAHHLFHRHFIASGRLDRTLGTVLVHAYQVRQRADYEAFAVFDTSAAADLLADVERLSAALKALVGGS